MYICTFILQHLAPVEEVSPFKLGQIQILIKDLRCRCVCQSEILRCLSAMNTKYAKPVCHESVSLRHCVCQSAVDTAPTYTSLKRIACAQARRLLPTLRSAWFFS